MGFQSLAECDLICVYFLHYIGKEIAQQKQLALLFTSYYQAYV